MLLSFPDLGIQLAARVLAETGDDLKRFSDARGLKTYAGSAPITRDSGKKHYVGRRMVKSNRLHHMRLPLGLLLPCAHHPARSPTTATGGISATGTRKLNGT